MWIFPRHSYANWSLNGLLLLSTSLLYKDLRKLPQLQFIFLTLTFWMMYGLENESENQNANVLSGKGKTIVPSYSTFSKNNPEFLKFENLRSRFWRKLKCVAPNIWKPVQYKRKRETKKVKIRNAEFSTKCLCCRCLVAMSQLKSHNRKNTLVAWLPVFYNNYTM